MNIFAKLFGGLLGLFRSDKARAVFERVAELVPEALPVVQTIAALTPTMADDEIVAVFAHFAVPFAQDYLKTSADRRGYLLLHLATEVLAEKCPSTPTNILNAAVQIAVTGTKAEKR